METILIIICVIATVSVFSSCLVILTPILFERMRSKVFMHLIAYISLGDLLGNLPYVIPLRPNRGNWWCDVQAFLNFAGYPMEWWWTGVLIFCLYRLSVTGRVPAQMWTFHCICWGIPIVTALLTRLFGPFKPTSIPGEVCLDPRAEIYHEFTYYFQFFFVLFVAFIVYGRIKNMEYFSSGYVSLSTFQVAKRAVRWYPATILIFWLPHFISSFLPGSIPTIAYQVFLVWKICHGISISCLFFYQSPESRRLWIKLFSALHFSDEKMQNHGDFSEISVEDAMNMILTMNGLHSAFLLDGDTATEAGTRASSGTARSSMHWPASEQFASGRFSFRNSAAEEEISSSNL